ncbi:MAG: cation:proton antiporter, partial [Candidatus Rokubacteria bacterium]|nr:cation:proton antiporter [Candidatus Rokubacteria bacterium]
MPGAAWAATATSGTSSAAILFGLAGLVVVAKIGGLAAERLGQPAVLGELLAGIGLGNLLPLVFGGEGLGFVRDQPALQVLAEIGVLILLFDVGLETDLRAFRRVGVSSLLVALIGVAVPFALGWGTSAWLLPDRSPLVHVFVGASLTATSVGITARVLKDLGASQSREAQTILGAAIIDDMLGLIVLAVVSGMATASGTGAAGPSWGATIGILLKAIVFLGLAVLSSQLVAARVVHAVGRTGQHGLILVVGVALCFTLAFLAEAIGLAAIIGAFAAGVLLDPCGAGVRAREDEETLAELLHPLSAVFVPLFFVLMGIQVDVPSLLGADTIGTGVVLVVAAIAGKLASALGVVSPGVKRGAVAIGMVPRGEVGLIFAGIGASLTVAGEPLLTQGLYSALVLMVVVTTLVTPIGLRRTLG